MYRANKGHLQKPLLSDLDQLSDKARQRLEQSWAGVFYREFFCRFNEQPFAVLYSQAASRPNTPINVLIGLETLKAGFGWSDQEMHDNFLFNIQVRYALGYHNLDEGEFELRTVYNFRERVRNQMADTGQNLIEQAFEQISDEQVAAFELKTSTLRMDSTQIASNIQQYSRLQLLVEMMQRLHRMLSPMDQATYAQAFAAYLTGSSGQYVYHLKGQEPQPHLQRIGELLHRLLIELRPTYGEHATYQLLERLFREQFKLSDRPDPAQHDDDDNEGTSSAASPPSAWVQVKPGQEISPDSLRSPDDPTATYRQKGQQAYQGYVTNLTETCAPDNPFQLLLKVQTVPNLTEDATLLLKALPNLIGRTQLQSLYNDAGFCSPEVDEALRLASISQVPSALQGRAPDPNYTHLADFQFQFNPQGQLIEMTCPHGYSLRVTRDPGSGRYVAPLTEHPCPECRFRKSQSRSSFRFSQAELEVALRRQRCRCYQASQPKLRAAIEAAVRAVKRPFPNDQTPVRGPFRVGLLMIGSAAMVNIRRIQRYLVRKTARSGQVTVGNPGAARTQPHLGRCVLAFLSTWWACGRHWPSAYRCCSAPSLFSF